MSFRKPADEARRLVAAFGYSMAGLKAATAQPAFCVELLISVFMVPAALWLGRSRTERALLAGSVMLVLMIELLNCGIEAAIDRISIERHPLSKVAKDVGSAAVFVSLLNAGLIWFITVLT